MDTTLGPALALPGYWQFRPRGSRSWPLAPGLAVSTRLAANNPLQPAPMPQHLENIGLTMTTILTV